MAFEEYTGSVIAEEPRSKGTPATKKSQPVAEPPPPVAAPTGFGSATEQFVQENAAKRAAEKTKKEAETFGIPEWMVVPLAVGAGGAGALAAKKGIDYFRNQGNEPVRIDPTFEGNGLTAPSTTDSIKEQQLRAAKARADKLEFELQEMQSKAQTQAQVANAIKTSIVPQPVNLTPADVAARAAGLPPPVAAAPIAPPVAPVAPMAPVAAPMAAVAPAMAPVAPAVPPMPPAAPVIETPKATEIKTSTAVSPKTRAAKTTITFKDTPDTWQKLTKEGTTFLPGYGAGDNNLFNTYGAEGRKAILEKFNNGKPIGDYKNYEELNKKLAKGVAIGDVPDLMKKLPAAEEAGNYGKLGKALKVGGIAGLGLSLSELANAKSIPEFLLRSGDIATDYIPGIGQFKQGMSGITLSSGTLDSPEARELFKRAKPTGAVPPPK
tara:strand:+ start:2184 stop:3491 length:1308 start_codon:yes stop_codon:yes gene_type:complete